MARKDIDRVLALTTALLVVAMSGCTKDDDPVRLGSDATTNRLDVRVEGPPCGLEVCTALPNAHVRVEFRDMNHTDPHDGGHLMITEAEGVTNLEGRWSTVVTYRETGTYAADICLIWVTHYQFGTQYVTRQIDANGQASITVQWRSK